MAPLTHYPVLLIFFLSMIYGTPLGKGWETRLSGRTLCTFRQYGKDVTLLLICHKYVIMIVYCYPSDGSTYCKLRSHDSQAIHVLFAKIYSQQKKRVLHSYLPIHHCAAMMESSDGGNKTQPHKIIDILS